MNYPCQPLLLKDRQPLNLFQNFFFVYSFCLHNYPLKKIITEIWEQARRNTRHSGTSPATLIYFLSGGRSPPYTLCLSNISRSPSSVRNGSTCPMTSVSWEIRSAKPPVAIISGLLCISSFILLTIPSTRLTYPKKSPDCMLATVFFPMAVCGLEISTFGSFDVLWKRASADMAIPGDMAPPRYSPFEETQSKVVAVPKSMIIRACLY